MSQRIAGFRVIRLAGCAAALVIVTAAITARVVSDDKGQPPKMSPEEAKMMEAMKKAGTPGEEHKKLAALVGKWSAKTKFWMDPTQPAEEGVGTATWKPVFDGRYFMMEWDGNSASMGPFQGISISGYDNVAKKYVDVWLDSMSTGMMMSWGTADASGRVITYEGEHHDCFTGQKKKSKSVTRMVSDTEMIFEMFDKGPDGKEFKNMEIIYHKQ